MVTEANRLSRGGFPVLPAFEEPGGSFINLPSRAAAELGDDFLGGP